MLPGVSRLGAIARGWIKELTHWRSIRPPEKLLVVLTGGDLVRVTRRTISIGRKPPRFRASVSLLPPPSRSGATSGPLRSAKTLWPGQRRISGRRRHAGGADAQQTRARSGRRGSTAASSCSEAGARRLAALSALAVGVDDRRLGSRSRSATKRHANGMKRRRHASSHNARPRSRSLDNSPRRLQLISTRTPQDVPLIELRALLAAEALSRSDLLEDRRALEEAVRDLPAQDDPPPVPSQPQTWAKAAIDRGDASSRCRRQRKQTRPICSTRPAAGSCIASEVRRTAADSLAFSGDERFLAIGGFRSGTTVFETATGRLVASVPNEGTVTAVALSDDGALLATGGHTGLVQCFRLPSATPLWSVHHGEMSRSHSVRAALRSPSAPSDCRRASSMPRRARAHPFDLRRPSRELRLLSAG